MSIEAFEHQSADKRDAILTAGMEEFSRNAYAEAGTDAIVRRCGISKGLLFHYFGSKKEFYCYCLTQALERLMSPTGQPSGSFYDMLFGVMDRKLRLCATYPSETRFVNVASRETSREVMTEKTAIFARYLARIHAESSAYMDRALATLNLRDDVAKVRDGLLLYSNAVVNKYLLAYQSTPDAFFARAEQIKLEMKEYLDLMLYGITKEDEA